MASAKPSVMLAIIAIQIMSVFSNSVAMNKCANSYCIDGKWPDITTVQSLPFYGSAVIIDKRNYDRVIILHRSTSMEESAKQRDSSNATFSTASHEHEFIEDDVIMILVAGTGKIVSTWGRNKFVRPHGIEVTEEGDLYVTDVRLHQVFKYLPSKGGLWESEPDLILGEKFISGNDHYHFCSPADVASEPVTKDIFVADGYCNSRVVKFNKDGVYLQEFGAGTSSPSFSPVIPFNVSHAVSIAMPHKIPDAGTGHYKVVSPSSKEDLPILIFVADRNNGRIQCFSENGTFLYEISHKFFGTVKNMIFSLALTAPSSMNPYGSLFVINGNLPVGQASIFELHVTYLGFNLVNSFPISNQPNYTDTMFKSNNISHDGQRNEIPHDITVTPDGQTLYVIEAYKTLTVKKLTRNKMTSGAAGPCSSNNNNFFRKLDVMIVLSAIVLLIANFWVT